MIRHISPRAGVKKLVHVPDFEARVFLMQNAERDEQAVLVKKILVDVGRSEIEKHFVLQSQIRRRFRRLFFAQRKNRAVEIAQPVAGVEAPFISSHVFHKTLFETQAMGHAGFSKRLIVNQLLPNSMFSKIAESARAVGVHIGVAERHVQIRLEKILRSDAQQRLFDALHLIIRAKLNVEMHPPARAEFVLREIGEPVVEIACVRRLRSEVF